MSNHRARRGGAVCFAPTFAMAVCLGSVVERVHAKDIRSVNLREKGELVVVGYVLEVPPPLGPRSIITLRYGYTSGVSWGLLWSEVYDGGGDDFPSDVAAVRVLPEPQTSFQSVGIVEHIFVVGSSEGANQTYDFTTILYTWAPSSTVQEVWVARYDPQNADDHAIAVQATQQKIESELYIVAVVTGVRQNEYDEWDWLTVKYDETAPSAGPPPEDKEPIWQIRYPQNSSSSNADDVPAALTIRKTSGIIQAWVTGFFSRSTTGDDMEVVHYEEVFP
jgi:hypothetical protein